MSTQESDSTAHGSPVGSTTGFAPTPADTVSPADVRLGLERILRSQAFARSTRLCRFLRFVVDEALHGRGDELKEYTIGVEAFEKPSSFDPRMDSIVRVEAARLRAKLEIYYRDEGLNDPLRIRLPSRGYRPSWEALVSPETPREPQAEMAPTAPRGRGWRYIVAGCILLAAIATGGFWTLRKSTSRGAADSTKPGSAAIAGETADAGAMPGAPALPEPKESTTVLRFASSISDPAIEYLGEGMTEEIISALSRPRRLRILAAPPDATEVSALREKLEVDTVVSGSVRESKGRIRITANVIQPSTGEYLWSGTFERSKNDVFPLQDDVALGVRKFLIPDLEGQPLPSSRSRHPEAYREYLTGRHYLSQRSGQSLTRAIAHFEKAIALDPSYAKAYAGLASAHSVIGRVSREAPQRYWQQTKWAATNALKHDRNLAEAHTRLAGVLAFYEWNWTEAEPLFRRAIELDVDSADAHHNYAHFLIARSRLDEALHEMQRAQEIDPVAPIVTAHVGLTYYMMRDYNRAIGEWRKAIERDPGFFRGHWELARAYMQQSKYGEAIAELEKAAPGFDSAAWLAACRAQQGNDQEARQLLRSPQLSSFDRAVIYMGMRDREHALEWLEKACAEHSIWAVDFNVDPMYDWLRADPRFQSLLTTMHL